MCVCYMQPGADSVTEAFVRIRDEGGDVESTGPGRAGAALAYHFYLTAFHVSFLDSFLRVCVYVCMFYAAGRGFRNRGVRSNSR
jgi:hypothetical protein